MKGPKFMTEDMDGRERDQKWEHSRPLAGSIHIGHPSQEQERYPDGDAGIGHVENVPMEGPVIAAQDMDQRVPGIYEVDHLPLKDPIDEITQSPAPDQPQG